MRKFGFVCAASMMALLPAAANAAVLTFEEIGVQNSVFPNYTQQGFVSQGFRFSNNADVIDISAGAPWQGTGPAYSGDFAVLNDFGGSLVMTRDGGGNFDLQEFFIKGWFGSSGSQTASAYLNNVLVGSVNYTLSGTAWTQVTTNFANVDRVSFNTNSNIVLLDNVNTTLANGGVPEPAAWAMMLAGFGLVGSAMRRREKVAVTFS